MPVLTLRFSVFLNTTLRLKLGHVSNFLLNSLLWLCCFDNMCDLGVGLLGFDVVVFFVDLDFLIRVDLRRVGMVQ